MPCRFQIAIYRYHPTLGWILPILQLFIEYLASHSIQFTGNQYRASSKSPDTIYTPLQQIFLAQRMSKEEKTVWPFRCKSVSNPSPFQLSVYSTYALYVFLRLALNSKNELLVVWIYLVQVNNFCINLMLLLLSEACLKI